MERGAIVSDDHAARARELIAEAETNLYTDRTWGRLDPQTVVTMAIAHALLALLESDRDQSRPATVCPGCSTAHRDPGALCDTCTIARPA